MGMAAKFCYKVRVMLQSLMRTIAKSTWISTSLLLLTSLLPWSASHHLIPAFRAFFVILAPRLWQKTTEWLTQPILFILVNLVILLIWITSSTKCADSDSDSARRLSEAEVQAIKDSAPEELPQMMISSPLHTSHEESCPSQADDQRPQDKRCFESVDEASSDLSKLELVEKQAIAPEKRTKSKAKTVKRINSEKITPASAAKSQASEATKTQKHKYEKRSASFSHAPSNVIVKDVSIAEGMAPDSTLNRREAMVIDKDELNERIEAFFARFREQLRLQRQESLRRSMTSWGYN